jgi:hypothetical protein
MRKVEYHLEEIPTLMDKAVNSELKDMGKIRKGFFHEWGFDSVANGDDKQIQVSRAIVEEEMTGQIHMVYPEFIKFLNPIDTLPLPNG